MRSRILFCLLSLLAYCFAEAQIVTTAPSPVQTDSRNIVITFHADRGNKGLAGLGPSDAVYAHTGVITNQSKNDNDWQYAPAWLDNSSKYKLKYSGPDTWELEIPDIRSYYGITAESVVVRKLMLVFRNADGSKEGKTASGGDIAVDVVSSGLHVDISSSAGPFGILGAGENMAKISVAATAVADISVSVNGKIVGSKSDSRSLDLDCSFEAGKRSIVIAEAKDNGSVARDTAYICALPKTSVAPYPAQQYKDGLVETADSYIFGIAAPGKKSVILVGSWDGFQISPSALMSKAPDAVTLPADTTAMKNAYTLSHPYFWYSIPKSVAGSDFTYFYIVDGERAVGDPYARLILDPDNDRYISSAVFPGLPSYPELPSDIRVPLAWHTRSYSRIRPDNTFGGLESKKSMVIYELFLRDFTSVNGDLASGTLAGAMEKLDYISSLGVDAIELMPVMEFGGNNSWGYNPNFYFAPDKAYGTPDDYRQFIAAAHAKGMAVILDVVFNQADSSHPWWNMYSPAENPFFNASSPHAYNVLNDWNQGNPLVEKQWTDALCHWLVEYGVDGFRFDLVKGLGDNNSYSNSYQSSTNTFGTPSASATDRFNHSRIDRMARLHQAISQVKPDVIFINEDLATAEEENKLASDNDLNWANINTASCQFAMGYQSDSDMDRFYAPLDGGRTKGSTVSYAESHDEERMAYKQQQWGVSSVKGNEAVSMRRLGSVAAMMLMSPGAHMIWQFQELGDAQPVKKADGNNDTEPRRDCWKLLDDPAHAALRDTYASLLEIRRKCPELFGLDAKVDMHCSQNDWAQGRTITLTNPSSAKFIQLVVNPNTDRKLMTEVPQGTKAVVFSPDVTVAGGTVDLLPGAFVIFSNDESLGIDGIKPGTEGDCDLFDINGRRVSASNPGKGIYIRRGKNGSADKVYIDR